MVHRNRKMWKDHGLQHSMTSYYSCPLLHRITGYRHCLHKYYTIVHDSTSVKHSSVASSLGHLCTNSLTNTCRFTLQCQSLFHHRLVLLYSFPPFCSSPVMTRCIYSSSPAAPVCYPVMCICLHYWYNIRLFV